MRNKYLNKNLKDISWKRKFVVKIVKISTTLSIILFASLIGVAENFRLINLG